MSDLSDKGSDCDDMITSSSDGGICSIKTCADCGTTKTPLWRGGPAGPQSLCNACGIRSRKKRRAVLGITKNDKKTKLFTASTCSDDSQSSGLTSNKNDFCLRKRLMTVGSEVVLQRPRSKVSKQRRKFGEEEQAAFLLMALSCGSVFA